LSAPAHTVPRRRSFSAAALVRRLNVPGLVTFFLALAAWELSIASGAVDVEFLAPPTEIAATLVDLIKSGELARNTGHTLRSVLIGWTISMVAGVAIGTLLGLYRPAWVFSLASIDFLRSLPSIALIPVAVLIFGFSVQMEVMVIVYASIWTVIINTIGGIRQVPRELHDVGRTFRLSRLRLAWTIVLPAAMPTILVGARLAMAVSLILAVISEMIGNPTGLGYAVVFEQQAIRPEAMFAYVVTIGVLGVILNGLLVAAARLLRPVRTAELKSR
jgi:ABC-type nitrate/sulfonate/bicarbonate transport system permease component